MLAIAHQTKEGIVLDGRDEVTLDFDVRRYDPHRGTAVLEGKLHGGAGETVVLIWPGGYRSERGVGDDEIFRFQELGAGRYELLVKTAGTAQSFRTAGQQDVSLELWMPGMHAGIIEGSVRGGAGRQIVLQWSGGRQETTVFSNTTFRFANLPPGEYTLRIKGTTVMSDPIRLGQGATAEVRLDLSSSETGEHFLLLGEPLEERGSFLAALRYAARFGPGVGGDIEEARRAVHVTIIGGPDHVSTADEEILRASGCQIHRIDQDIAAKLESLVKEGRPF
jgi:hypothetical protein